MSLGKIAKQWTSEQAAAQAQTTYQDYKKIKGFKDVGYLLQSYVVSGGEVTKDIQRNDTIDVTDIAASIDNNIMARDGASFATSTLNTVYYLDFHKDGDWHWGTTHPTGTVGIDYLTVASVTTDSNGMVNVITDTRGPVGGFRLESEYGLEGYATTEQLADKASRDLIHYAPPVKTGLQVNSPKLVVLGAASDEINVIQYIGGKYAIYKFDTAGGDTGPTSVGGVWDLIRIKKATLANNAYVAKKNIDAASTVGTLITLYAPAARNTFENEMIYQLSSELAADYLSASGDTFGVGVYGISGSGAASSVTWKVNIGTIRKGNILVFGSGTSSTSADILVNGEVVKTFDPSKLGVSGGSSYKTIDFEMPLKMNTTGTVDITLRNNDTSGKNLYFACANFMWLKDYDGRDIDFYKVFTTSNKWIDSGGSSDYAIYDEDLAKWCGSYHGGETRISAAILWSTSGTPRSVNEFQEGRYSLRSKTGFNSTWLVMPKFRVQQVTNINEKGRMLIVYDFNVDGTIEMSFSFYDGTIRTKQFYTALTATHVNFNAIGYPRYESLPAAPQGYYFSRHEGSIVQRSGTDNLSLGIRHSRYDNQYQSAHLANGWILNHASAYKKYYYGPYDGPTVATVNNLIFVKYLDFYYGE